MSFTTDLVTGVAQILHAAGIATWRPTGAYTAGETGIYLRTMPQSPDAAVVLSEYPVDDQPVGADSIVGLQVRTRTPGRDPRGTDDLDDAIFDALHGRPAADIGGVRVTQMWRQSGASLGPDGNGRWERTSNYYLTLGRVTQYRN